MSKLGKWSTTPGSNNATPPDGWPEGQAPSTVNDCAREMMASIRTVFNDAQWFDQDFTPTFINATSFSVAGDQTSAIHAGRRLKIYDATAGVATVIYATVLTASFTAVTTISVSADGGQLTSSLSSFAIAIISQNNSSLPRQLGVNSLSTEALFVGSTLTVSGAATLNGALSVGGAAVLGSTLTASGAVAMLTTLTVSGATVHKTTMLVEGTTTLSGATSLLTTLSVSGAAVVKGALSVGGAATFAGTLSVSGTVVAANVCKAFVNFAALSSGGNPTLGPISFNVSSVSRSATGVYKVTFSNAFADANYVSQVIVFGNTQAMVPRPASQAAATCKVLLTNTAGVFADDAYVNFFVYR